MRASPISLVLLLLGLPAAAETGTSPYAGLEGRGIKALSADEIAGLLEGAGMGFAMAAELNRYPGPKHVLELAGELELSPAQRAATERVFEEMRQEARRLGAELVGGERELDRQFAAGEISEEALEERVGTLAALRGRLRTAHLRAHLRMRRILSAEQIARYVELRGYGTGGHDPAAHHGVGAPPPASVGPDPPRRGDPAEHPPPPPPG